MKNLIKLTSVFALVLSFAQSSYAQEKQDLTKLSDKDLIDELYGAVIGVSGSGGLLTMDTQMFGVNWIADQVKSAYSTAQSRSLTQEEIKSGKATFKLSNEQQEAAEKLIVLAKEEVYEVTIIMSNDVYELVGASLNIVWALQEIVDNDQHDQVFNPSFFKNSKFPHVINASQVAKGVLDKLNHQETVMLPGYFESSPNFMKALTGSDSISFLKGEKPLPTDDSFKGQFARLRRAVESLVLVSAEFDRRMAIAIEADRNSKK